jgi:intracellular sulfur oxidation DsrE/DsrF family protein
MKKILLIVACFLSLNVVAQTRLNPVLKSFGSLADVPFAKVKADSSLEYKIVVEFRQKIEDPKELHPFLENIGRMYNIHIYDKVPQDKLHVVVVIFGPASYCVLNNEAYKEMFKKDNPNLEAFKELKKAGVKVLVCGQSVVVHNIDPKTISSDVEIASSRFTAVSTCQMNGYALFQMN